MAAIVGGIGFGCSSTTTVAAPTTDTDAATIAPATDSGPVKPGKDSGGTTTTEGGTTKDSGPAVTCAPGDVAGFTAKWKAPRAHKDACSQVQIDTYLTACLGSTSSAAKCAPFQMGAGKVCGDCISSKDTDATLGALISHGGYVVVNVAGCVALADNDLTGARCAGKLLARDQCAAAACAANCPVTDDASLTELGACTDVADGAGGGCETHATAAVSCAAGLNEAGGAAATCLGNADFESSYGVTVPIFCLNKGTAVDSGTDSGTTPDAGGAADAADGG